MLDLTTEQRLMMLQIPDIIGPSLHHRPPLFEQVCSVTGGFRLVLDRVRQSTLGEIV
jgi:hypothetical protein